KRLGQRRPGAHHPLRFSPLLHDPRCPFARCTRGPHRKHSSAGFALPASRAACSLLSESRHPALPQRRRSYKRKTETCFWLDSYPARNSRTLLWRRTWHDGPRRSRQSPRLSRRLEGRRKKRILGRRKNIGTAGNLCAGTKAIAFASRASSFAERQALAFIFRR